MLRGSEVPSFESFPFAVLGVLGVLGLLAVAGRIRFAETRMGPRFVPRPKPAGPDSSPADPEKRYELLETIGRGGMGVVRRARDRVLGRLVAIKSLTGVRVDVVGAARFVREARALASLNDPNIVTIFDLFESPALGQCIVMELVSGRSLGAALNGDRIETEMTVNLGIQLSRALARVHAAGIVHRDLKPDNVMITPEGNVKILDFGIALISARPHPPELHEDSRLTESGSLVGTPSYMSPEQIRGEEVDSRTDVFSLGCILYEMIAGRRPFAGNTVAAVFHAILNEAPAALASSGMTVDPALESVVLDALVKDRVERRISMAEISDQLCRIRDDRGNGVRRGMLAAARTPVAPVQSHAIEHLYVDRRRLDSYLRQLSPLHAVANERTIEDQFRSLIDGLQASRQLGVSRSRSMGPTEPFAIEVVDATRLRVPQQLQHDFAGLNMWVAERSTAERAETGALYLIEDAPSDKHVDQWSSGLSALWMLSSCVRGLPSGRSFGASSQQEARSFSKDPVAFLKSLGAKVGATRRIRVFYRIRATFMDLDAPNRGEPTTVGYPIVISEWGDVQAEADRKAAAFPNLEAPIVPFVPSGTR